MQGCAWLEENLREVMIVVACGDHMEAHQYVKRKGENWQIPPTVDGSQGTGHYGTGENNTARIL